MTFNPFAAVNCRYGAPMGRHGHDASSYDGASKLYARHMGGGSWCTYVEAYSKDAAINIVRSAP